MRSKGVVSNPSNDPPNNSSQLFISYNDFLEMVDCKTCK